MQWKVGAKGKGVSVALGHMAARPSSHQQQVPGAWETTPAGMAPTTSPVPLHDGRRHPSFKAVMEIDEGLS